MPVKWQKQKMQSPSACTHYIATSTSFLQMHEVFRVANPTMVGEFSKWHACQVLAKVTNYSLHATVSYRELSRSKRVDSHSEDALQYRMHARKRERSSEISAVRSLVPTETCNPRTSGTCSAKHKGATRAGPDNWKMKALRATMHCLRQRVIVAGQVFFLQYSPGISNINYGLRVHCNCGHRMYELAIAIKITLKLNKPVLFQEQIDIYNSRPSTYIGFTFTTLA